MSAMSAILSCFSIHEISAHAHDLKSVIKGIKNPKAGLNWATAQAIAHYEQTHAHGI